MRAADFVEVVLWADRKRPEGEALHRFDIPVALTGSVVLWLPFILGYRIPLDKTHLLRSFTLFLVIGVPLVLAVMYGLRAGALALVLSAPEQSKTVGSIANTVGFSLAAVAMIGAFWYGTLFHNLYFLLAGLVALGALSLFASIFTRRASFAALGNLVAVAASLAILVETGCGLALWTALPLTLILGYSLANPWKRREPQGSR